MTSVGIDLSVLTIDQRIALAQELWDSIHSDARVAPFSPEQIAEIDRRVAAADAGEMVGIPWEDVRDQLLPRK